MEYNYQLRFDTYTQAIDTSGVYRLPDYAWVPNDPANTDWQAYQVWLSEGNTPLPPAGA
jgi:hypothetical protein